MIPVVFVHFGASPDHLRLAIEQARKWNDDVVCIGDRGARRWLCPRGVPLELQRDGATIDAGDAALFGRAYAHLSMNHYAFELQCFQRWFVLREWMRAEQVNRCLYLDSDVLVFANAEMEWAQWHEFGFTLSMGSSAHTSFWKADVLSAFCEFLLRTYRDRDRTFRDMDRIFREMRAQSLPGGISDMALLKRFAETAGLPVGEMSAIREGTYWDHNLNVSDGFRMKPLPDGRTVKEIDFSTRTVPYGYDQNGGMVQFKSIHFQGQAKDLMGAYVCEDAK